ncbi:MAG TPA: hypothetical protein VIV11_41380 [Kofleriaceae bacterium]
MKLLALLVLLVACSESKKPEIKRDHDRQRLEPPTRGVRALPPHAIRADGVGPYKLGATVTQLLDQLPSGPRITQFSLPGVIQRDILRAEDGAILIGTEPQGKAMFVSVVRSEIARTESGVHVGSTREQLEEALGAPVKDPERAQDPRIVIPSKLEHARALFAGDRIVGLVLAAEPERPKDKPNSGEPRDPAEAEKAVAKIGLTGVVFSAMLRNPNDGRDDIVAIVKREDALSHTWALVAYRANDGKYVRTIEQDVYQLTAANARWIGAELRDLELYLELTSRADSIEVGGLLTTRVGEKIRDIVVIQPVSVARKRAKPIPHDSNDAGTSDAQ